MSNGGTKYQNQRSGNSLLSTWNFFSIHQFLMIFNILCTFYKWKLNINICVIEQQFYSIWNPNVFVPSFSQQNVLFKHFESSKYWPWVPTSAFYTYICDRLVLIGYRDLFVDLLDIDIESSLVLDWSRPTLFISI